MTTKNFCDLCGKENKENWYIEVKVNFSSIFEIPDTCKTCYNKFRKLLKEFKDGTR